MTDTLCVVTEPIISQYLSLLKNATKIVTGETKNVNGWCVMHISKEDHSSVGYGPFHSHLQAMGRFTLICRLWAVSLSTAGYGPFHSHLQDMDRFTLNCRLGAVSLSTAGQGPFHFQLQVRGRFTLNCRLGAVSLSSQGVSFAHC